MLVKIPSKADFQKSLDELFRENEKEGNSHVDVRSGDLHRRVGGYPGLANRMPTCCDVMYENKRPLDKILNKPPKGKGASLEIKYTLPRKLVNQAQYINKEDSKLTNYCEIVIVISGLRQDTPDSWNCPVCQGKGVMHDPFLPDKQCPACQGEGRWKANIRRDMLLTCNRCNGKGKIEFDRTLPLGSDVCPICHGSGKRPPGSGKDLT
jgi:hypothetical protein